MSVQQRQDAARRLGRLPLLESEMMPGERRRLGFIFLSGAGAVLALRPGGRFYLWEGRIIGEAEIIVTA
jgi:hypothetical protein